MSISNIIKEKILNEWFDGKNVLSVKFDPDDYDKQDMALFRTYFKCIDVADVFETLNKLLTSPYIKQLKGPVVINCMPRIQFYRIDYPYINEYNEIERRENLYNFVDCVRTNIYVDMKNNGNDKPIYLSIITFGLIKVVNFLPSIIV
jgi:hypothetical protein